MLVSFLSMGWRVGIVVAAALPLTVAAVFVVMAATGKDFDRITLGSLILRSATALAVPKLRQHDSRRRCGAGAQLSSWASPMRSPSGPRM
jgi:hypothetical protein